MMDLRNRPKKETQKEKKKIKYETIFLDNNAAPRPDSRQYVDAVSMCQSCLPHILKFSCFVEREMWDLIFLVTVV